MQEHGYQGIRKGDLVIHAMDAFAGAIGVSDSNGKSSPVYSACTPINGDNVYVYYYAYLLRYMALSRFIESLSKGIRERSTDFRFNDFSNLRLVVPHFKEQTTIANFLDYKTEKIDQAVAIKEKQIQLLKERKQILIQTAVTKGLDPNVPMADSGVEWIGQIPAHWEKTRLKFVSKIQSGLTLGKQYPPGNLSEYPYLRVANVQNGFFNLNDVATIYLPKNEALKYLLSKHDILVTEGGDIDKLGRGTVWESDIEPCLHQNHIFAIRIVSSRINCNFIAQFMTTEKVRKYFIDTATKTTNLASTNRTTLGNLTLLIPPLNEQNKILSHIHTQSAKIDKAIAIQAQMIEKLKEYKATLINAAVTGKIKVPDPAESKVVA